MATPQTTNHQKIDPFDIVLFGATGDLAMRKLMRAMYRRIASGQIQPGSKIFAVARSDLSTAQYLEQVHEHFKQFLGEKELTREQWETFCTFVEYVRVNATVKEDFQRLSKALD